MQNTKYKVKQSGSKWLDESHTAPLISASLNDIIGEIS